MVFVYHKDPHFLRIIDTHASPATYVQYLSGEAYMCTRNNPYRSYVDDFYWCYQPFRLVRYLLSYMCAHELHNHVYAIHDSMHTRHYLYIIRTNGPDFQRERETIDNSWGSGGTPAPSAPPPPPPPPPGHATTVLPSLHFAVAILPHHIVLLALVYAGHRNNHISANKHTVHFKFATKV